MGGKPAARLGDATTSGGPIIQGSIGVLIGAPSGVACSACPGGMAVGNPVNPLLGSKVLSDEIDLSLPGGFSFTLARSYSSYQTKTPAPVGIFGPGWQSYNDLSLKVTPQELIINDASGRSIHFELMIEGEVVYSRSEHLWLVRGGIETLGDHSLDMLWRNVPLHLRMNNHFYFVTDSLLGPCAILGYSLPEDKNYLPQSLPDRLVLQGLVDRFGQIIHYVREQNGLFKDQITQVIDGVGRHYHLKFAQCLQGKQNHSLEHGWGKDSGIRLVEVYLTHDSVYQELPKEPLVRYDYSSKGELTAVYYRSNNYSRSFIYDEKNLGQMIGHSYAGRPVTSYKYDTKGRVIAQKNPFGLDYNFHYYDNYTEVSDSLNRKTLYYFVGEGGLRRLVKHVRPDGSIIENEFDKSGRLIANIDPFGRKTEYELDTVDGKLLTIYLPDGRRVKYDYNKLGQLTKIVEANGSSTKQKYDELGRLISVQNALGEKTQYIYDEQNKDQLRLVEDPSGKQKQLHWTQYSQLASYTDCSGKQSLYHYDLFGNLVKRQWEEALFTTYEYDIKNRLIFSENSAQQQITYHYNDANDVIKIKLPDGSEQQMNYDAWGRVIYQEYGGLTKGARYDAGGRLTEVINESGARMAISYDAMSRIIGESGFDQRKKNYSYDMLGRVVKIEDGDQNITLYYDDIDNLVKREIEHGGDLRREQFIYGAYGLEEAIHWCQSKKIGVAYERDALGRIVKETQSIKEKESVLWCYSIAHRYSLQGLRESSTYDGLPEVCFQTYGSGHLMSVLMGRKSIIDFERDNLHREQLRQFGDFQLMTNYDAAGRLSHLGVSGIQGGNLSREHYYNQIGQLTTIITADGKINYHYDVAGRLKEAKTPLYHQQYHFDKTGNLIPSSLDDIFSIENSTNRIHGDLDYHYHYDTFGNLTQKTSNNDSSNIHKYTYDDGHRLHEYVHHQKGSTKSVAHSITGNYYYDAFGRRMGKTIQRDVNGVIVTQQFWYGWDEDRLVLTEKENQRIYTIYLPDTFVPLLRIEKNKNSIKPIKSLVEKLENQANTAFPEEVRRTFDEVESSLRKKSLNDAQLVWLEQMQLTPEVLQEQLDPLPNFSEDQIHYYHCDHLGTPVALINQNGKIDWQIELDPFGQVVTEKNPRNLYQPIRMQGQHYDEESGLFYNRYRYYDSKQGRYITQDPIGLLGGMNFYRYPTAPTMVVDPRGLVGILIGLAVIAGAALLLSGCSNSSNDNSDKGPAKFDTADEAAIDILNKTNPTSIKDNREYSGMICMDSQGKCFATTPKKGDKASANPKDSPCPKNTDTKAYYHTHGATDPGYDNENFSGADTGYADSNGMDGYVGTPGGRFGKYNHKSQNITYQENIITN